MKVDLFVKNKMAFIDSTLPKPEEKAPTYTAWTRANNVLSRGSTIWYLKKSSPTSCLQTP